MTVFLRGLKVFAHHGLTPEERSVGQHYEMDLEVEAPGGARYSDALTETVDYTHLASIATSTMRESQCRTVERLAQLVAEGILADEHQAKSVKVRIAKVSPPMDFAVDSAGTEFTLER